MNSFSLLALEHAHDAFAVWFKTRQQKCGAQHSLHSISWKMIGMAEGNKQDWTIGTKDGLNCLVSTTGEQGRNTLGVGATEIKIERTNERRMVWIWIWICILSLSFLLLPMLPCLALLCHCYLLHSFSHSLSFFFLFSGFARTFFLFVFVAPLSMYSQLSSPIHLFVLTSLSFLATPCAIF